MSFTGQHLHSRSDSAHTSHVSGLIYIKIPTIRFVIYLLEMFLSIAQRARYPESRASVKGGNKDHHLYIPVPFHIAIS